MNSKEFLTNAVVALIAIGLVLISIPFIKSLDFSDESDNKSYTVLDLTDMKEGELRRIGMVHVYKRTQDDINNIDSLNVYLDDPNSNNSRQPVSAKNKWRSENPNFSIVLVLAPVKGCAVDFVQKDQKNYTQHEDAQAIQDQPHFRSQCEKRVFDVSGRILTRKGASFEKNLIVPDQAWQGETIVTISRGL